MKRNNIILITFLSIFAFFIMDIKNVITSAYAKHIVHTEEHSDHDHENDHEDKGYVEVELSNSAIEKYGIKSAKFDLDRNIQLPISCIVKSKNEYFVYTRQDNDFKEYEIYPISIDSEFVVFKPENQDSEFITDGAEYLRIVFSSANGPEVGHVH